MMAIWMMEPSNIVLYFTIPVFKFGVKVSDSCHQKDFLRHNLSRCFTLRASLKFSLKWAS